MIGSDRRQTPQAAVEELKNLLCLHSDKRIVVVGTTCTGKSTMISSIPGARDMDKLIFPLLSREEAECVCRTPWTEEIGRTMSRLVRERVRAVAGQPLFGTVVVDSDLVVLLKISDALLRQRITGRKVEFQDAKNMQQRIEAEARESGIRLVEFPLG